MQPRQLHRIPRIGLHAITGPVRDQRWRDDRAINPKLREATRDHEARRSRFVTDPQLAPGMRVYDPPHGLFQDSQVPGYTPVISNFTIGFRDGDGDGLRVDVQSEIE